MEKRGLLYFTILSLFFYNFVFSTFKLYEKEISISDIIDRLKKIVKEKKEEEYKLVEVFVEGNKKEDTKNLAKKESKKGGKITEEKGYSYYNEVRFLGNVEGNKIKFYSENNEDKVTEYKNKNSNQERGVESSVSENKVDILPNLYINEKIIINMDSDNNVSIDAERFEYSDYLLKIARSIFYRIVEFIPAFQISKGFIASESGIVSGSIGLYFQDGTFNIVFITPFKSPNMNALIIRAFSYIYIEKPPDDLKVNFIIFSLKIYTSNLKVEGSFKFDITYKGKRY